MSTDEPTPNPLYDSLASSGDPYQRHGQMPGEAEPSWLAQEAYARLQRAAVERALARASVAQDDQLKPATVDVEVDTDKADLAVLDLQFDLVESGHAKVKVDAAGHVGLQVDTHLPPALHNRAVLVALNQRIARAGYAPRRRP